ncbi:unnamed protein product [Brugia timori]|uniref:Uncharacterized protein n=1 Tax=Brugia timori TaxID=42155 RepID=A0A3P7U4L7_9BILA|nr:unnamed protein product [Brugia timori]
MKRRIMLLRRNCLSCLKKFTLDIGETKKLFQLSHKFWIPQERCDFTAKFLSICELWRDF